MRAPMRSLKPSLLARWAIPLLLLATGYGGFSPSCQSAHEYANEIATTGDLNDLVWRSMDAGAPPQWSPDGRHIIFTEGGGLSPNADHISSNNEITGEIYRVASDGSDLQLILAGEGPDEIFHSPRISPDGTRIVYVTTRHEVSREEAEESVHNRRNFEVETALLDGTDRRRLTENYVQDTRPLWSPDSSSIAFYTGESAGWSHSNLEGTGIYTMAMDGSDRELIFPREPVDLAWLTDMDPVVSYWDEREDTFVLQRTVPDRESVAPGGSIDLDADDDDLAPLRWSGRLAGPTWSPDGKHITFIAQSAYARFISDSGATRQLYAVYAPPTLYTANADGSDLTPVFSSSAVIIDEQFHIVDPIANVQTAGIPPLGASPVWSPDGRKIAFLRYVDSYVLGDLAKDYHVVGSPGLGLYEIGIDGSGLREIAIIDVQEELYKGELSWSPDGKSLLLSSIGGRSIPSEIHIVRVDGSAPRLDALGLDAFWSPDGSRIAVLDSSSPDGYPLYRVDRLYTMAPDGTDIQWIVERAEDGELRAVNQVEKNCFLLLFCR